MSQTKAQLIDGQGEINLGGLDIDASAPDGSVNIDSNGKLLVGTSTASGSALLQVDGDLAFDSGYGSVATAYGCRACVNFDGTGTVAMRESCNVSSITDNGTGNYTVNFTTAMPDANYAITANVSLGASESVPRVAIFKEGQTRSTTSTTIYVQQTNVSDVFRDNAYVEVVVFR